MQGRSNRVDDFHIDHNVVQMRIMRVLVEVTSHKLPPILVGSLDVFCGLIAVQLLQFLDAVDTLIVRCDDPYQQPLLTWQHELRTTTNDHVVAVSGRHQQYLA